MEYACSSGSLNVLQWLVGTKGCDVHFASEVTGMTSLLFAAHGGHKHVLRYLIETLECDLHHRSINGGIVNLICRG